LFYNNTRVIQARLLFCKQSGSQIEVFCLAPYKPFEYQSIFLQTENCVWSCMIGNLKKWKSEKLELNLTINRVDIILEAEKIGMNDNKILVSFTWNGGFTFGEIINEIGYIPIPPYLKRNSEDIDKERYQTVYSKMEGSVAAPTAGLHFTKDVLKKLDKKQVSKHEITLHIGAGTFQPVKSDNALDHSMHSEFFTVSRQLLVTLADLNRPIISTGTTTLRALESIYWLAVKSILNKKIFFKLDQWDYTNLPSTIPVKEALAGFINLMDLSGLENYSANTQIMIVPGYNFKIVDGLITNFHQPKSTLLLLIAAFVGENWNVIYNYAQDNNFRFLSYGDSSLLWRQGNYFQQ
jgi:S-adenosylmethionine:tRNA ribosyltransferase-isomerase